MLQVNCHSPGFSSLAGDVAFVLFAASSLVFSLSGWWWRASASGSVSHTFNTFLDFLHEKTRRHGRKVRLPVSPFLDGDVLVLLLAAEASGRSRSVSFWSSRLTSCECGVWVWGGLTCLLRGRFPLLLCSCRHTHLWLAAWNAGFLRFLFFFNEFSFLTFLCSFGFLLHSRLCGGEKKRHFTQLYSSIFFKSQTNVCRYLIKNKWKDLEKNVFRFHHLS